MIDQASVFAERFKGNPQVLQATVLGQGNIPGLDPYTALNALRLIKESNAMQTAAQAQQPTSSPSIVAENMAPPPMQQGLGAMIPNTMGQAPQGQAPQGQAPQGQAPQAPVMQASGGLAGMPVPEEDYAAGGIVAFQEGGLNRELTLPPGTAYDPDETGVYPEDTEGGGDGNAGLQATAFKNYQSSRKAIEDLDDGSSTLQEDRDARKDYLKFLRDNAGPDIYKSAIDKLNEREGARSKRTSQGQGLALLAAAGAILEGNTLARGASKAFPVFAKEMGEVQRADMAEQRSIEQMRFALDDAQRKERMGDVRGAQAAAETARKLKGDATRFKLNKANALATLDAKALQATRSNAKGAGAGPKVAEQLADAELKYARDPSPENLTTVNALRKTQDRLAQKYSSSITDTGPNKTNAALTGPQVKVDSEIAAALTKFKNSGADGAAYRSALRNKDSAGAKRLLDDEETRLRKIYEKSESATASKGGAATGTPKPKVIKLD